MRILKDNAVWNEKRLDEHRTEIRSLKDSLSNMKQELHLLNEKNKYLQSTHKQFETHLEIFKEVMSSKYDYQLQYNSDSYLASPSCEALKRSGYCMHKIFSEGKKVLWIKEKKKK